LSSLYCNGCASGGESLVGLIQAIDLKDILPKQEGKSRVKAFPGFRDKLSFYIRIYP
jgi:hypothetical protein